MGAKRVYVLACCKRLLRRRASGCRRPFDKLRINSLENRLRGKPFNRENINERKPFVAHVFRGHAFSVVLVFGVKRFRELATVFLRAHPRTQEIFARVFCLKIKRTLQFLKLKFLKYHFFRRLSTVLHVFVCKKIAMFAQRNPRNVLVI